MVDVVASAGDDDVDVGVDVVLEGSPQLATPTIMARLTPTSATRNAWLVIETFP